MADVSATPKPATAVPAASAKDVTVRISAPASAKTSKKPSTKASSTPASPIPATTPTVTESTEVAVVTKDARAAFQDKDADASIAFHKARANLKFAEEQHGGAGSDFVKSIVFGGLDGIITTFSIVAAVAGASLAVEVTLMMGFANLLADGISMGVGDFLSSKAEHDYVRSEYSREAWEYDNFRDGEIDEMVKLYVEKGVEEKDAIAILTTMAKYKDVFVEHMMNVELGQQTPDPDENPAKDGAVTFFSFLTFGSVPMWAYIIMWGAKYTEPQGMFGVACAVTAVTMFALGAFQAKITRQPVFKSGMLMMFNGSLAAAAAYLVGFGLEHAIGRGDSC